MLKVYTKYDSIPNVIRVPMFKTMEAKNLSDSTIMSDQIDMRADITCEEYIADEFEEALEGVRFVKYKKVEETQ